MTVPVTTFLCLLVACVGVYLYFIYTPSLPEPPLTGKAIVRTIVVGQTRRAYINYAPAHLATDRPLLIVLHGTQQNGKMIRSSTGYQFDRYADSHNFTVVYPDGIGGVWNDCRPKNAKSAAVDDTGFINALIEDMGAAYGIAPHRIYLFGYSNGGQMAFRLISEQPDRFAGAAVVGANLPTSEYNQCQMDAPTPPILLANGTADPITPFDGGRVTIFGVIDRGRAISAEKTAQNFADRNHVERPTREAISPEVEHWVWKKQGFAYIERYAFKGAGHVIPQPYYRFPRLMGVTPSFNLPEQIIHFFSLDQERR